MNDIRYLETYNPGNANLYKGIDNCETYLIIESRDEDQFIIFDWDVSDDMFDDYVNEFENGGIPRDESPKAPEEFDLYTESEIRKYMNYMTRLA